MNTKKQIIEALERNKGGYISGESLANELNVSRTAVWKTIKSLIGDGYRITSVRNKEYCLTAQNDVVSVRGITKYLDEINRDLQILAYPVLDSTNAEAKKLGESDTPESLVIAASQTGGRGRKGRTFFSPDGTGIYMSLLLRPSFCQATEATRFTTMAAVAVCRAIESLCNKKAEIKWVNDVFVDKLKVCGILTEAAMNMENGLIDYAVAGIGINVYKPRKGFPKELKNIAGAIFNEEADDLRNRLIAEVVNRFFELYRSQDTSYVSEYRKRSMVIGKKINVVGLSEQRRATALDIDDDCRLIVRYENGETATLSSGEISVRL